MSATAARPEAVAAAAAELGALAELDAPLGRRTTYRVGGPAAVLVHVGGIADLDRVAAAVAASGLPTLVVGKGSNLLVADAGFPGIALVLGPSFEAVEVAGTQVEAGGATPLPVLARKTAAAGLTGLEWAVGVPGTVGGGVRMNAGGHGSDVAATLVGIRAYDLAAGQHREVTAADLALGYRSSAVGPACVVTSGCFRLAPRDPAAAGDEVAAIVRWRREHQPGGQNAGSVFTNPPHDAAGRLVDAAGCRGLRRGSAQVSEKHANFIQADADGSADDVRALIDEVVRRVEAAAGVRLHPELRMVGFEPAEHPQGEVEG